MRGVYLAVVTIAFGLIVENVAIEWQWLTGGTTGLIGIPGPNLFGFRSRAMPSTRARGHAFPRHAR